MAKPPMTLYAENPLKGKRVKVGSFNPDTCQFTKPVKRSKHYFHLVNGYALQLSVYKKLKELGAEELIWIETDTGKRLYSTLEDWERHGRQWSGRAGKQVCLSEKYFDEGGLAPPDSQPETTEAPKKQEKRMFRSSLNREVGKPQRLGR